MNWYKKCCSIKNKFRDFCNLILQPPIVVTTTAVADDPQTTKTTELTSTTLEEKSTSNKTTNIAHHLHKLQPITNRILNYSSWNE